MDAGLMARQCAADEIEVLDTSFENGHAIKVRQATGIAREKRYLMSAAQQFEDDMLTDVACAACKKDAHARSSLQSKNGLQWNPVGTSAKSTWLGMSGAIHQRRSVQSMRMPATLSR